jgi:uncharacterized protein (DUF1501 family)
MKRRQFVKYSALASTSFLVPQFLKGFAAPRFIENAFATSGNRKILVVVQLSGGNDGLNTVIPYKDDIYYKLRPQISKNGTEVLKLNDELALNPGMTGLKSLFDDGKLSIVNSVGYPNPDRSHFRSMDIWHSASGSNENWHTGWVGRYLDSNCAGADKPYSAIETDNSLSLSMKGAMRNGIALENPEAFYAIAKEKYFGAIANSGQGINKPGDNLHYLYKTFIETGESADYIFKTSRIYKSKLEYPKGEFGKNLNTIANLIISGLNTSVYYVSLSGFDTHDLQVQRQDRLLKELSEGLTVFVQDLKDNDRFNEVVIMSFSEFGRRVAQNASNGTDHGTANNMLIINGNLKKPGIYNSAPDLQNLDQGDLVYKIDFREIYSEMLGNWLGADSEKILGKKFNLLGIV